MLLAVLGRHTLTPPSSLPSSSSYTGSSGRGLSRASPRALHTLSRRSWLSLTPSSSVSSVAPLDSGLGWLCREENLLSSALRSRRRRLLVSSTRALHTASK